MKDAGPIRKLLVRAPNWVGDAVLVVPALRVLRRHFAQAEIAVLAKPWVADVYREQDFADRLLVYDSGGEHAGLLGLRRLSQALAREQFDLAVLLQNAFQAAVIAAAASIPHRVGYARDGRGFLLTQAIPVPPACGGAEAPRHEVYYYLEMLRRAGWLATLPEIEEIPLRVPAPAVARAEEQLRRLGSRGARARVVLAPGAAYGPAKCWPAENYRALVRRLVSELDADVIVCGSAAERELARAIAAVAPSRVFDLAGQTTLNELMAVVACARLFVGNDSGAAHLAAALRLPQVVIFGPTDASATGPINPHARIVRQPVECSPCGLRACPVDHRCMTRVGVEVVLEAARVALAQSPACGGLSDASKSEKRSAVFLDRDGTISAEVGYVNHASRFQLFPWSAEALRRLRAAGYLAVVVTNQSGVARGYFSEELVREVHLQLQAELGRAGTRLDGIYYCPHHPQEGQPPYRQECDCRKPKPGMLYRAAQELSIDLSRSLVVSDKYEDVAMAHGLGLRGVLVLTGYGRGEYEYRQQLWPRPPDIVAENLLDAVNKILNRE